MTEQRDRILACACELYLKDGLDGFSMRKLARAVGVTAPALYRHYDGKERVLIDVVGEAYQRMSHYLYRALQGRTPEERFRMAADGYVTFALEQPRLYEVLFASPDLMGMEGIPDDVETQACAIGQFWNDRVREVMDAGILREQPIDAVGLTLWAQCHGLISLHLSGMLALPEPEFRHLFRNTMRRVLRGLATETYRARIAEEDEGVAEPSVDPAGGHVGAGR